LDSLICARQTLQRSCSGLTLLGRYWLLRIRRLDSFAEGKHTGEEADQQSPVPIAKQDTSSTHIFYYSHINSRLKNDLLPVSKKRAAQEYTLVQPL
jgi:hypothetical protein